MLRRWGREPSSLGTIQSRASARFVTGALALPASALVADGLTRSAADRPAFGERDEPTQPAPVAPHALAHLLLAVSPKPRHPPFSSESARICSRLSIRWAARGTPPYLGGKCASNNAREAWRDSSAHGRNEKKPDADLPDEAFHAAAWVSTARAWICTRLLIHWLHALPPVPLKATRAVREGSGGTRQRRPCCPKPGADLPPVAFHAPGWVSIPPRVGARSKFTAQLAPIGVSPTT